MEWWKVTAIVWSTLDFLLSGRHTSGSSCRCCSHRDVPEPVLSFPSGVSCQTSTAEHLSVCFSVHEDVSGEFLLRIHTGRRRLATGSWSRSAWWVTPQFCVVHQGTSPSYEREELPLGQSPRRRCWKKLCLIQNKLLLGGRERVSSCCQPSAWIADHLRRPFPWPWK